jgi:putative endonuclease
MNYINTVTLGKSGEDLAIEFLKSLGYKIIHRNYYSQYGEIDIIALDDDLLVFLEVKTRTSNLNSALSSVSFAKQLKLSKTASFFLSQNHQYEDHFTRFDLIVVLKKPDSTKIQHHKDAFTSVLE